MRLQFALSLLAVTVLAVPVFAEDVTVKYRGEVPLDTFECTDTERSSFVKRVCYDADQEYLILSLKGTYYHYCDVDQNTVDSLLNADSIGKFFNREIKGDGADGPFDCRTHQVPSY